VKLFTDRYVLTPGPTEIPYRVRRALTRETTNPDLDPEFAELYEETRRMLKTVLGAEKSSLYVMVGEAMLGLESALANSVGRGTKVLVVGNGVFGEGFAELVKMHGGVPVVVESCEECWRRSADASTLDRELERNKDAEVVTLVHCDTPSGILNDLRDISKVVKQHGAFLVVDAVSSAGGVEIGFDSLGIDMLISGSQKVFNAPPGLTIMAVSSSAWDRIERVNYRGFYLDLKVWRDMLDHKGVFPYTMSDVLVYALHESLKMMLEEGLESVFKRHELARNAAWKALKCMGLEPYPVSIEHSSPTVTAFLAPEGVDEQALRRLAWEKYGVMFGGSWGRLQGKVLRIGHMGVQASRGHLILAVSTLARVLKELGFKADAQAAVSAVEEEFSA